jgi:uncharacterized alkaline shock family protein YloU
MKMDKNLHKDRSTDLGTVRISNDAIATIASAAAMEVRGVHKMGGGVTRTFCEHLFKRSAAKGIKIILTDSEARLSVSIIAEYGGDIPRMADEVQENVKRAVEKMTGLVLSEVDVIVEGVHAELKTGGHRT